MKKSLCVLSVLVLIITSCNAYFENRRKPDEEKLSKEEREILGNFNPLPQPNNSTEKKNIGDIENDIDILVQIPDRTFPRASVQKEVGAHGRISRIDVKISPPYPEKMIVEVYVLSKGTINYIEYPVKVEGIVIQDDKQISEFKTVMVQGGGYIRVPIEDMYPLRFEVTLWDKAPNEVFSTLIYAKSKLYLYPPNTPPDKIFSGSDDIKPIEETEILSNPLRITLIR